MRFEEIIKERERETMCFNVILDFVFGGLMYVNKIETKKDKF